MNGFEKHSLNDDNFSAKGSIVSAFDAFRMLSPSSQLPHHHWGLRNPADL